MPCTATLSMVSRCRNVTDSIHAYERKIARLERNLENAKQTRDMFMAAWRELKERYEPEDLARQLAIIGAVFPQHNEV